MTGTVTIVGLDRIDQYDLAKELGSRATLGESLTGPDNFGDPQVSVLLVEAIRATAIILTAWIIKGRRHVKVETWEETNEDGSSSSFLRLKHSEDAPVKAEVLKAIAGVFKLPPDELE